MKHTATPWEKDYGGTIGHIKSMANINDPNGKYPSTPTVCRYDVMTPSISKDEQEANAAFIVKACNSFYGMLEALENVDDFMNGHDDGLGLHQVVIDAIKQAEK